MGCAQLSCGAAGGTACVPRTMQRRCAPVKSTAYRGLLVGAGLEDQSVVHFPVGDLMFDLAVVRVLFHEADPAVLVGLCRVDDFLDEVLPVYVSDTEPVLPDEVR